MPPTATYSLLGFAPPVVKDGEVITPVRLGDEVVHIAGTPDMWQQIAQSVAATKARADDPRRHGGRPRKSDSAKAAEGRPITKPGGGL